MAAFNDVIGMRAIVCKQHLWPQALKVSDIPLPAVRPGHVLLRVAAAGVNFADMLVIGGSYQEKLVPPFVPGAEVAGTVVAIGEGVEKYAVGDRLMGQVDSGGYAEYALLDQQRAAPIPEPMTFREACGFYISYGTAYAGLVSRARLTKGETVIVTGAAGAVGRAAVEVAAALGACVIAVANGQERRRDLLAAGAAHAIDNDPGILREHVTHLTAGRGADVVFDVVGGEMASQSLRCLAFEGRLVLVGFASGEAPRLPANHLLVKNVDAIGFYWGPYQTRRPTDTATMFERLGELYQAGRLKPHTAAAYPLERTGEALMALTERKHSGKIAVEIDQ